MTYQQISDGINAREKVMIKILCWMRVDETGYCTTGLWNKMVYKLASLVAGRDAFDRLYFYCTLLDDSERGYTLKEIKTECEKLKTAFK